METSPPAEGADRPPTTTRQLEALFRALESPLLAYAMQLTRHSDVAQDCVQEAFLRLHPRLAAGEISEPRAWLYRTVHHLVVSSFRASSRVIPLDAPAAGDSSSAQLSPADTLADPAPLPDADIERLEAAGLARLVLERLDPRSRELVTLKFYQDLSYKEIAARTGLTIGHVGYILHHTLKKLALELARAGLVR
jgi:RNA polymerase sigma factor (sigma-70 family)